MSKGWRGGGWSEDARKHSAPTLTPGKRSGTESSEGSPLPRYPGKRTLTEDLPPATFAQPAPAMLVQRKAVGAESTPDPIATAQHGTSGSGGPLPHLDQIQKSFGRHDVSNI